MYKAVSVNNPKNNHTLTRESPKVGSREFEELLNRIFGKRVPAIGKRPAGRIRES